MLLLTLILAHVDVRIRHNLSSCPRLWSIAHYRDIWGVAVGFVECSFGFLDLVAARPL